MSLIICSRYGAADRVRDLLAAGNSVHTIDPQSGSTALHEAAANGHPPVVSQLLSAGAKIGCLDKQGRTPLHAAAQNGHAAVVQQLIAAASLQPGTKHMLYDVADSNGSTALHEAAKAGLSAATLLKLAKRIERYRLSRSISDCQEMESCYDYNNDYMNLPSYRYSVNSKHVTNADRLCSHHLVQSDLQQHAEIIQGLLEAGANPNQADNKQQTPLHIAVTSGNVLAVKLLLAKKAAVNTPDDQGRTPLLLAVQLTEPVVQQSVVAMLLQAGACPDYQDQAGFIAAEYAVKAGYTKLPVPLLQQLLEASSVTAAAASKALLRVSLTADGSQEIVQCLLAAGANASVKASDGTPMLHTAVRSGTMRIANLLLRAGADVAAVDSDTFTALHIAAAAGHDAFVKKLLAAGAAVNAASSEAVTPLHEAAVQGHVSIVQQLLAAGASVNAVTEAGRTALIDAAGNGCDLLVQTLLAAGADLNLADSSNNTALAHALYFGHEFTLQQLLSWEGGSRLSPQVVMQAAISGVDWERFELSAVLLQYLAARDPSAAQQCLMQVDGDEGVKLRCVLLQQWGQVGAAAEAKEAELVSQEKAAAAVSLGARQLLLQVAAAGKKQQVPSQGRIRHLKCRCGNVSARCHNMGHAGADDFARFQNFRSTVLQGLPPGYGSATGERTNGQLDSSSSGPQGQVRLIARGNQAQHAMRMIYPAAAAGISGRVVSDRHSSS